MGASAPAWADDGPALAHGLALGRDHRELEDDPRLPDALVTGLEHALRLMAVQAYAKVSVRVAERSGDAPAPPPEATQPPASGETAPNGTPPPSAPPGSGNNDGTTDGGSGTTGGTGTSTGLPATVATALGFSTTTALQSALEAKAAAGPATPTLEGSTVQAIAALGSNWQWSHQRAVRLADGGTQVTQDYAKTDSAGQQTTVSLSQEIDRAGQATSATARVYTDLADGKGIAATFTEDPTDPGAGTLTVQLYNFQSQTSQVTVIGDASSALAGLEDILAQQGITGSSADAMVGSFTEALRAAGIELP